MNTTPHYPEGPPARSHAPAFELHHPDGLHIACGLEEAAMLDQHSALVVVPRASMAIQRSD